MIKMAPRQIPNFSETEWSEEQMSLEYGDPWWGTKISTGTEALEDEDVWDSGCQLTPIKQFLTHMNLSVGSSVGNSVGKFLKFVDRIDKRISKKQLPTELPTELRQNC
jgi:hypothetical protein